MIEKAGSVWSKVPQWHGALQAKSDCPALQPQSGEAQEQAVQTKVEAGV